MSSTFKFSIKNLDKLYYSIVIPSFYKISSDNSSYFIGFYIDVYFFVSIKSPTLEVTILDVTGIEDIYGLFYN